MPEDEEELVGKYTQLIFECTICKKVYKKPGMCSTCDAILKPKGG
jgi:hypothetical protein